MGRIGNIRRCLAVSVRTVRGLGFGTGALYGVLVLSAGCSKPAASPPVAAEPAARPSRPTEPAAPADTPAVAEKATPKKQKGGIPMDAFFDNPLEIVANSAVVAGPPAAPANTAQAPATEMPADTPKATTSGDWAELMPVESLQSEVKKIQNRLKASLQGQGTYNGNYKDISVDGSVIAALAAITLEHSGEVPWKANAAVIRDLGHELSEAASGLGKDNYEKSKSAFEKLDSVFGGAVPADAPKSDPKRPAHETADRSGVMKRIEKARNHLRDNINTEGKLKGDAEGVLHETLLIATLGKLIAKEGYSSADEADYQQYADALINGAKEASTAVKDQSFQKFTEAMNKVNKSCDQCHANYGTG